MKEHQGVRIVVHHSDFEFAADLRPVDVVRRDEPAAGVGFPRIGAVAENKAFRRPFLVGETAGERNGFPAASQHAGREKLAVIVAVV